MTLLALACVALEADPDTAADSGAPTPTCELPEDVPDLVVESGALDGWLLFPWYDPGGGDAGVVLLDPDGCVAWSEAMAAYPTAARWSGSDIWFNQQGPERLLHRRTPDGSGDQDLETPLAHHDFYVHADGTVAWIEEEVRELDGESIRGDLIRERGPDGTTDEVWSAFTSLPLEEHEGWELESPHDWTHANGLDYDAARGNYLISLAFTAQVLEIERASRRIVQLLDGDELADGFHPQHAPSFATDGVRIFDNDGPDGGSRLLEIGWDGQVRWSWTSADGLTTPVLGDVHLRDDGVVIGSFGTEGRIVAVDPDGRERWRVAAPGMVVGRVDWRAERPE